MKQSLSIPAYLIFSLEDGTVINPEDLHKHLFRFAFVDWNFVQILAVYLQMMNKDRGYGVIEICEDKVFHMAADEACIDKEWRLELN